MHTANKCMCGEKSCTCFNREGMTSENTLKHITTAGPLPKNAGEAPDDYSAVIKDMSLETNVSESHKSYCDSLAFAGLPTGASSCTTLEETGRSYGTADFVGLTSRKFCKARQLATPASDSRRTPSHVSKEWCDIDMDELV
jgi:hypothetical protein